MTRNALHSDSCSSTSSGAVLVNAAQSVHLASNMFSGCSSLQGAGALHVLNVHHLVLESSMAEKCTSDILSACFHLTQTRNATATDLVLLGRHHPEDGPLLTLTTEAHVNIHSLVVRNANGGDGGVLRVSDGSVRFTQNGIADSCVAT